MTIYEAAKQGISRLRLDIWSDAEDYLKLDLVPGGCGPWGHLWARRTQEAIGEPTPQTFLVTGDANPDFIAYEGVVDPEDR